MNSQPITPQQIIDDAKGEYFYELSATWVMSPQCIVMSKKTFAFDILRDNAPIVEVRLKSAKQFRNIDYLNNKDESFVIINALIDTGAPRSIIDISILNKGIKLRKTQSIHTIIKFDGSSEDLPVYKVGLELSNQDYNDGIENCVDKDIPLMNLSRFKILDTAIEMLIGRDILSRCILTYNGLNNTYTFGDKL